MSNYKGDIAVATTIRGKFTTRRDTGCRRTCKRGRLSQRAIAVRVQGCEYRSERNGDHVDA